MVTLCLESYRVQIVTTWQIKNRYLLADLTAIGLML
jgi:hypothetical protein